MEFVLLLGGEGGASASAFEIGGRTGRMAAWVAEQRGRGVIRQGGHIEMPTLRVKTVDGRTALVDVPVDDGAPVRTWLLIDSPDLETALTVARSCPEAAHGDVRVLPVDPAGALP